MASVLLYEHSHRSTESKPTRRRTACCTGEDEVSLRGCQYLAILSGQFPLPASRRVKKGLDRGWTCSQQTVQYLTLVQYSTASTYSRRQTSKRSRPLARQRLRTLHLLPYGTFYHTSDRVHFRKYLRNLVPFAMQHVESLHLNSHSVITSTTVQYCQQQALDIPETPESPSGLLVTRAIWPDSHARNTATPAASDPTHDTIRQTATQPSNDQTGLQRDT